MSIVIQIFAFLLAVFILVSVHEFGHFWVAKRVGIKVLRFSVGFGKVLWSWRGRDDTEYCISMIPVGGYVKMLDEREGNVSPADRHRAFDQKPWLSRLAVVVAGPGINLLFAVLVFWVIYAVGITRIKPILGNVPPQSIAAKAGLSKGDQLLSVGGHRAHDWQSVIINLITRLGDRGTLPVTVRQPSGKEKRVVLDLTTWKVDGLEPRPLQSLGLLPYRPYVAPVIGAVQAGQAAAKAGLKTGDLILSVNGEKVKNWFSFVKDIQKKPDVTVDIKFTRNGQVLSKKVTVGHKYGRGWKKVGYLGVGSAPIKLPDWMKYRLDYRFWQAWKPAFAQTWLLFKFNAVVLAKMAMGKVSLQSLGGPITIFRTADQAFHQGMLVYLGFLALLSIMLAFINILPIPGLDGGHVLYLVIEAIKGKPLSVRAQLLMFRIGLILILVLLVHASINDIMRIFR